jgi:hypothetical protein
MPNAALDAQRSAWPYTVSKMSWPYVLPGLLFDYPGHGRLHSPLTER